MMMPVGCNHTSKAHCNLKQCVCGGQQGTTSRKAAAARPGAGMTLVPSGMDAKGKARLAAFARAVGARMAPRNKWCDAVTHVVCGIATRDGTPK